MKLEIKRFIISAERGTYNRIVGGKYRMYEKMRGTTYGTSC